MHGRLRHPGVSRTFTLDRIRGAVEIRWAGRLLAGGTGTTIMGPKIIGTGVGRTGTYSLKKAITQLGPVIT
jgi:hypothetical protein